LTFYSFKKSAVLSEIILAENIADQSDSFINFPVNSIAETSCLFPRETQKIIDFHKIFFYL